MVANGNVQIPASLTVILWEVHCKTREAEQTEGWWFSSPLPSTALLDTNHITWFVLWERTTQRYQWVSVCSHTHNHPTTNHRVFPSPCEKTTHPLTVPHLHPWALELAVATALCCVYRLAYTRHFKQMLLHMVSVTWHQVFRVHPCSSLSVVYFPFQWWLVYCTVTYMLICIQVDMHFLL